MKVMHYPPSDVRAKICKLLEKEGKELVHLSYAKANRDDRQYYIGIAYNPQNCNEDNGCSRNRYDIVTYATNEDVFVHQANDLHYENALIEMGRFIRTVTYGNK